MVEMESRTAPVVEATRNKLRDVVPAKSQPEHAMRFLRAGDAVLPSTTTHEVASTGLTER